METTISLPPDLKAKAECEANARRMTLSEFVRESLELAISQNLTDDPLFSDRAVYCDDAPADLAANHDRYLYGKDS